MIENDEDHGMDLSVREELKEAFSVIFLLGTGESRKIHREACR